MFLKQTPTSKGIFLQIVESYYDNGVSRQRVIEKIGYLDQLNTIHDDPISFFKNKAKKMTLEKKQLLQIRYPLIWILLCPYKKILSSILVMLSLMKFIEN